MMPRSLRTRMLLVPGVLMLALIMPSASVATHMVPAPFKFYWDPDVNGTPGPEPAIDPEGGFWESVRRARLDGAIAEWSTETQFDTSRSAAGEVEAFVDGRLGWCINAWETMDAQLLAVVCREQVAGINPSTGFQTYWRITNLDMYFNMERAASPNWWIGSTLTSDPGRLDFQGVMTHEIGHLIRLVDVDAPGDCTRTAADQLTMCGAVRADGRLDTWRNRSLHSHDINGANAVY